MSNKTRSSVKKNNENSMVRNPRRPILNVKVILALSMLVGTFIVSGCSGQTKPVSLDSDPQLTPASPTQTSTITSSNNANTSAPSSPVTQYKKITNNAVGVSLKVPISWKTSQIQSGMRFIGTHADFLITDTSYSYDELDSFAEAFLQSEKTYTEKERTSVSGRIQSTGALGRAFRRVIFFENGIGNISLIDFRANPDFLDEYQPIFSAVQNSVQVISPAPETNTSSESSKESTVTDKSDSNEKIENTSTEPQGVSAVGTYYIADTGGEGVLPRDTCAQAAERAFNKSIPEGERVKLVLSGTNECSGWMQVKALAVSEVPFWVRAQYLSESAPKAVCTWEKSTTLAINATVKISTGSSRGTAFHMGNGYFYTAAHVITGYTHVTLENHAFTLTNVSVVKADIISDSALLKADISRYPNIASLDWGEANNTEIGQEVRAVGYPPGVIEGEGAITAGIISKNIKSEHKIQTDAALNPGNSGGPLFDKCAKVIGIVVSGRPDYDGIAYARSEQKIRSSLEKLPDGAGVSSSKTESVAAATPAPKPIQTGKFLKYPSTNNNSNNGTVIQANLWWVQDQSDENMIDIAAEWQPRKWNLGIYNHFLAIYDADKQFLFKACLGNAIALNNDSVYAHLRVKSGIPANPLKYGELCTKGKAYGSEAYDLATFDINATYFYEYTILPGDIQGGQVDLFDQDITVLEAIAANTSCKVVFKVRSDNVGNKFEPGRKWIIFRNEKSQLVNVAKFAYYSESRDEDGKLVLTKETKLDQGVIYTAVGYSAYCDNAPAWHTAELIGNGRASN